MIHLLAPEDMKKCTKCGEYLPLTAFGKQKKGKSGLSSWCKKCKSAVSVKWNNEHKDRHKLHVIQYQERKEQGKKTLAQRDFCVAKREFSHDILGGYKINILNYTKKNEYRYNVVRTDGRCYCTNDKGEFLRFLENRV